MEEHKPSAIRENVLQAVEKIPAFPKSVQQVLQLTARLDCAPKDLVSVLENDPIFTLKILKVVNSPFIGLATRIHSIQQACVYLGVNTLKNLALSLASMGVLPRHNKAGLDMNEFWLHSLAVALVSRRLAHMLHVPVQESSDFFSAGLLHDVGKAVLALSMPDAFAKALSLAAESEHFLYDAEYTILQTNHADVGALLARRWGFPEPLVQGIAMHHTPEKSAAEIIVICVFTADQICKFLRYGHSGESGIQPLPIEIEQLFGMDFQTMCHGMPDLEQDLDKARVFINA